MAKAEDLKKDQRVEIQSPTGDFEYGGARGFQQGSIGKITQVKRRTNDPNGLVRVKILEHGSGNWNFHPRELIILDGENKTKEEYTNMKPLSLEEAKSVTEGEKLLVVKETKSREGQVGTVVRTLDSDRDIRLKFEGGSEGWYSFDYLARPNNKFQEILKEELKAGGLEGEFTLSFKENGYLTTVTADDYEKEVVIEQHGNYGKGIEQAISDIVADIIDNAEEKAETMAQIEELEEQLAELKEDSE